MTFHTVNSIDPNNVMVKAADTEVLFIPLANMEKIPSGIIVWLKRGRHANNTLGYVNKNKLHQALDNCISRFYRERLHCSI